MIRNRWHRDIERETITGVSVKPIYAYDNVARKLVEVGSRDFEAYVNSFYEVSLLKNKLLRFKNGDITALNCQQGIYADISGMPRDFNSMNKLVRESIDGARANGFDNIQEYMQGIIDGIFNKSAGVVADNEVKKEGVVNE